MAHWAHAPQTSNNNFFGPAQSLSVQPAVPGSLTKIGVLSRLQSITRISATVEIARDAERPFKVTQGHPLLYQSTLHI